MQSLITDLVDSLSPCHEKVRIAIHYWKSFNEKEKLLIHNTAKILHNKGQNLEYMLVHISDDYPLRLFNTGIDEGVIESGVVVILNNYRAFVSTTGSYGQYIPLGTPVITQVEIEDTSSPEMLNIINACRHVYALSRLNWRGANIQNREPVSIDYSRELAYMIGALGERWPQIASDPDIRGRLGNRLWFI
jgi:hypothetical protein